MKAERWNRLQNLLDRALGMTKEEREPFLQEACADDSEMMTEVVELLDVDELVSDFLEETIADAALLAGSSLDPLLSQRFFGKYEILSKVGEGGFGSVHKGRDPILKRMVAIKTCNSSDERLRQRFIREAEISAALQHPNITIVHDLGFEQGLPFLVQEFLSGEDLSRKISRRDEMSPETRLDYLLQTARGLDHAHRKGVLHRDVKPNNVRVLENGRVKILDFGIARLMEEQNPITSEGVAMGTLGYLSPEQLDGRDVDQRSDIFSFGVLAYELLTFARPFQGKTISQTTYRLLHETPEPIATHWPACPDALEKIVARCLEKDPKQRYSDMRPLIADLESVALSFAEPSSQAAPLLATSAEIKARRQRQRWLAAAAVFLTCLILIAVLWRHDTAPPTLPKVHLEPTSQPVRFPSEPATLPDETALPKESTEKEPTEKTTPTSSISSLTASGSSSPLASTPASRSEKKPLSPPTTAPPKAPISEMEIAVVTPNETESAFDNSKRPAQEGSTQQPQTAPSGETLTELTSGQTLPSEEPPPDDPAIASTADPASRSADRPPIEEKPRFSEARVAETAEHINTLPEPLTRSEPIYPQRARSRNLETTVEVRVLVDEQGTPVDVRVSTSDYPGLGFEDAAEQAVRNSKFRPGLTHGVPTRKWTRIVVVFRLQSD